MNPNNKTYGIIVEWKNEGPLIMEGKPMNYVNAHDRLDSLVCDPRVIRVAIFHTHYVTGNETLIEGDKQ